LQLMTRNYRFHRYILMTKSALLVNRREPTSDDKNTLSFELSRLLAAC